MAVYPEGTTKPPVGEGLNKNAQVTLDLIWPTDKTTRKPINVSKQYTISQWTATNKNSLLTNDICWMAAFVHTMSLTPERFEGLHGGISFAVTPWSLR